MSFDINKLLEGLRDATTAQQQPSQTTPTPEVGQPANQTTAPAGFEAISKPEEEKPKLAYKPFFGTDTYAVYPSLKREKPRHRIACEMIAAGVPQSEVCEKLGYSPSQMTVIKKQPWAEENIHLMQSNVRIQVVEELKSAALEAAQTLAQIMRNSERDADRAKAANSILDRLYPTGQVILHGKIEPNELSDAELIELIQEKTG